MEVMALYMLLAIGFVVGVVFALIVVPKNNISILLALTLFSGILGAIVTPYALGLFNDTRDLIHRHRTESTATAEYEYFSKVIDNKISASDFATHYSVNGVSYSGKFRISREYDSSRNLDKIALSNADLITLIDSLEKYPEIVAKLALSKKLSNEYRISFLNKLIRNISESEYYDFLSPLAQNADTPDEILVIIAVRARPNYLEDIYENKSAPEIAKHVCTIRRYSWMGEENRKKNPFPHDSYLNSNYRDAWIALATDSQEQARITVAQHPATPPEILDLLAFDKSADVLCWTFLNKNISDRTRRKIASFTGISNDEYLYTHASNYNYNNDYRKRMAIAKHPGLSQPTLEASAKDNYPEVRKVVAARHDLPESLCIMLNNDRESDVRKEIANNPACSRQQIGKP